MNKKVLEYNKYLSDKKIAIIGAGVSNIPLISYMANLSKDVVLFDKNELSVDVMDLVNKYNIGTSVGEGYLKKLVGFDVIFRSPSCLPNNEYLKAENNTAVISTEAKNNKDINVIVKKAVELSEPRIQALMAKGLLRRPARIMVVGLPNVGKSSIINKLTRSSKTKIGAKAGVTRQQQWVRINPQLELLDTPGIIPMKQEDQERAKKLAFVNSVSENAYSNEIVAQELLDILNEKQAKQLREFYKLPDDLELNIDNISIARNWLLTGGSTDRERTSVYILRDFREGKIGKFILDKLPVETEN